MLAFWISAAIHWAGVIVNLLAPRLYDYRGNLPRSQMLTHIFVAQAMWVTLLLAAMGGVCFWFYKDLCSGQGLGLYLCVFLLLMWFSRLVFQVCIYKTAKQSPLRYTVFTLTFLYQTVLLTGAVTGYFVGI